MLEAQVLEQHLETVDAEAVGDRCVDVERLAGDAGALLGGHGAEGLHVVQPVGELDEDDANVLDHRQHHLAKAFRLRLGPAAKLDLVEFADAVDEAGDLGAELLLDVFERSLGVLDRVVQDRRGDRLRIEVHVGKLLRHGDRMRDIRFARFACLALVGGGAELVGVHHTFDGVFREVILECFYKLPQAVVALGRARQFCE